MMQYIEEDEDVMETIDRDEEIEVDTEEMADMLFDIVARRAGLSVADRHCFNLQYELDELYNLDMPGIKKVLEEIAYH